MNENKNVTYQNLRDLVKVFLEGKFIYKCLYYKKGEYQINNLCFQSKEIVEKEQTKPRASRRVVK